MATLLITVTLLGAAPRQVPLHPGTSVRFATVEQSTAVLTRSDEFTRTLSPFDRQVRMRSAAAVSEPEFLRFVGLQVVPWQDHDAARLGKLVRRVGDRLAKYQLRFPQTILLIHTTGEEESHAAYCRGSAIIIPRRLLKQSDQQLEGLLIHELFHILSRNNPGLRRRLYATIGFQPCEKVTLPADLQRRRITNPDAPTWDWCIKLEHDGRVLTAVPVLFASVDNYDPRSGGSLFQYLTFRLLEVEQRDGRWQAVVRDGTTSLLVPEQTPSYARQIGRNTRYVIHPEEIMADNFMHLVLQRDNLPDPGILRQLEQQLQQDTPATPR